jgi:exodeoxyribonuclease V beta subunit
VQIVTVHACKGLEFPVVFCPFLCDGGTRAGGITLPGLEYHDADLEPVIDFREYDKTSDEFAPIKAILQSERAAETVRLLYVALTRAVHRCYLVAGTYACGRSIKESTDSMLNWLVKGQGKTLEAFFSTRRTAAEIDAAWDSFARRSAGAVDWLPLPQRAGTRVAGSPADAAMLSTPAAPGPVSGGWRLSSYSGLTHGARSEQAAGDHDARAVAARGEPPLGGRFEAAAIAADDMLRFPRGPSAGECVHAVFESLDFTDPDTWDRSIAAALLDHPQTLVGYPEDAQQQSLAGMLKNLVTDVTEAILVPGLRLSAIPWERRLTELEFTFPVPHLSLAGLNATLESLGYDVPALTGGNLKGYLKGFIDLVFEHQGRFFILDWKSNHLGYQAADYAADQLAAAMAEHGYHLQYLIYTVALDRYLRLRLENYDFETHFGGVLYLFVRGVRAAWADVNGTTPGVYFHRPSGAAVARLNQAFDSCC